MSRTRVYQTGKLIQNALDNALDLNKQYDSYAVDFLNAGISRLHRYKQDWAKLNKKFNGMNLAPTVERESLLEWFNGIEAKIDEEIKRQTDIVETRKHMLFVFNNQRAIGEAVGFKYVDEVRLGTQALCHDAIDKTYHFVESSLEREKAIRALMRSR